MDTEHNYDKIVIDLTRSAESVPRDDEEFIQRAAIRKFEKLLLSSLEHAKSATQLPDRRPNSYQQHNTIVIDGGRGSGKSTLLHKLLTSVQRGGLPFPRSNDRPNLGEVEFLGVIDPNQIEAKEIIFLNVLELINAAVETRIREIESTSDDTDYLSRRKQGLGRNLLVATYREALRELAGGLPLLDRVGKDRMHDDWDDALYVMEVGLQRAHQSNSKFRASFQTFLQCSCQILDKSLFLVAFDDADIAFEYGWQVLETVRKYLNHPQLLVVMAGDLQLYSKLVRQRQTQNLGMRRFANEQETEGDYSRSLDELQDQYLMKVLKPANRITLVRLNNVVTAGGSNPVCVRLWSDSSELLITEFIDRFVSRHFHVNQESLPLYRSVILRQPVRSAIQLLYAFHRVEQASQAYSGTAKSPSEELDLALEIGQIFLGSLMRCGISWDEMLFADAQDLLRIVRQVLQRNNLWDAGYRLRPDLLDEDHNLGVLVLSAKLSKAIQLKAALIFDYFIKLCLPHEANRYVPSIPNGNMSKYLHFISRDLREDSLTEARQNVAVIVDSDRSRSKTFASKTGVIRVYGMRLPELKWELMYDGDHSDYLGIFWEEIGFHIPAMASGQFLKRDFGRPYNTWAQLQKCLLVNDTETVMGQICNLLVCDVVDERSQSLICLSIYNLLGSISYILNESPENAAAALRRAAQIRSYPVPSWSGELGAEQIFTDDDGLYSEGTSNGAWQRSETMSNYGLLSALEQWRIEFERYVSFSPPSVHFLARVWSRFYFTVVNIDSGIPPKSKFLGWMVHRYIIAFLNAALVEEAIDLGYDGYTLNNPVTDDRNFLINLGMAFESAENRMHTEFMLFDPNALREHNPFFAILFACPMWAAFLHPRATMPIKYDRHPVLDIQISQWQRWMQGYPAVESLKVPYRVTHGSDVEFANLYDPLNSVLVMGRTSATRAEGRS